MMENRPLPPGWIAKTDAETNRTYYIDTNTGQTTWVDPRLEYYAKEGDGQLRDSSMSSPFSNHLYPNNQSLDNTQFSGSAPLGFAFSGPAPIQNNQPIGMPESTNTYTSTIPVGNAPVMPNPSGGQSEFTHLHSQNNTYSNTFQNEQSKLGYTGPATGYVSGGSNQPGESHETDWSSTAATQQTPSSSDSNGGDQERFLGINKPSIMGAVVGGIAGKLASKFPSNSSQSSTQPQQYNSPQGQGYGGQSQGQHYSGHSQQSQQYGGQLQGQYYGNQPQQGQYHGSQPQGQQYGSYSQGQQYGGQSQGQFGSQPTQGKPPKESGLGSMSSLISGGLGGMALGMVTDKLLGGQHQGKK